MDSTNYKKASTCYLFGNIFNKGIAFLTVPIFTRILSTTDYGIVTTYNSWISILGMFMGFTLHMGVRMASVDYKEKLDDFMSSIILFISMTSFGIVLIVTAGAVLLNVKVNILLLILCLLQAYSAAVIEDYSHYLMMQYRYKFRTILMVLPNLIAVIFSIIAITLVLKTDLYLGRIIPTAVVYLIFGIIIVLIVLKKGKRKINWGYVKYGLAISAPLIVHGIALNILSQSDRTMITWLADASQTGIYSLIYNFSMIATVITTSLEGVWIPWFTNRMTKKEFSDINKLAIDYINLMTYAMVCLILVAPEIVRILASKDYWEGITIIPPIVLANYVIFIYTLYVNIEHYYKKTANITINTVVAAFINIVLNFVLIPKYGYVAAAYTTLTAYVVTLILHSTYAKKLEKSLFPVKMLVRPIIHICTTTVIFYFLIDYGIMRWALMIVYFALMLLKEKNRIFEFFPELKQRLNIKR